MPRRIQLVGQTSSRQSCKMVKFSTKIEMLVYRFIMSLVIGFFVGSYIIPNSNNSVIRRLGDIVCQHAIRSGKQVNQPKIDAFQPPKQNNERGILYIGMMSMKANLETRVKAAEETWSRNQRFRFEIFSKNNGTLNPQGGRIKTLEAGARIIQLPGVSDISYPPQKKSFSMFKFIYDNYVENFDWFLRLDDDAYVNVDKLVKFLSNVDPSKPHYIGNPGFGKEPGDFLAHGENYCMGGTGVIVSQELLRQIGPKLSICLKEMYTEHEDIELGRCIRRMTGVACTQAWETTSLFFQNYGGDGSYQANIKDISERRRNTAMTFHALKDKKYQYKFHQTMLGDRITDLMTKIMRLQNEIKSMSRLIVRKQFDVQSWNAHAGLIWTSISRRSVYSATLVSPVHGIPSTIKRAAVDNVYYTIQDLRARYPTIQKKIRDISVMRMDYIVNQLTSVDMITKLKVYGKTRHNRDKTIYLNRIHFRRTFLNKVFFRELADIDVSDIKHKLKAGYPKRTFVFDPNTRVNFVMALSGRPQNLVRFLQNFKDCFLSKKEKVSLTIVYFPEIQNESDGNMRESKSDVIGDDGSLAFVARNIELVKSEHPGADMSLVPVKNGRSFSRGVGLQMGADKVRHNDSHDELLFFCDVDLIFESEILMHIRRNTVAGKQAYYPVFFSQYDPDIVYRYQQRPETHFYFEEIAGFWRTFSFGMVSIYKSDFLETGGFDLSIEGWGLEDLRFADAVLKTKLTVFKSNEPAMVHIFHDKYCAPELEKEQQKSCQNSRAQHYGPQTLMFYLWHRGPEIDVEEYEPDVNIKMDGKEDVRVT